MTDALVQQGGKDLREGRPIRHLSGDMAEENVDLELHLGRAKEQERRYDWKGAAAEYESLLKAIPSSEFRKLGDLSESLGYAQYRYAMQSKTAEDFRNRIGQAKKRFADARALYQKCGTGKVDDRLNSCDAWSHFLDYWLADSPSKKKEILAESWDCTKRALDLLEKSLDHIRFVDIFDRLEMCCDILYYYIGNLEERDRLVGAVIPYGEKAIQYASNDGDQDKTASLYTKVSKYAEILRFHNLGLEESQRYEQKAMDYWRKAWKLSESATTMDIPGHAMWSKLPIVRPSNENREILQKALSHAKSSNDRFVTGSVLHLLADEIWWHLKNPEDTDQYQESSETAYEHARNARDEYDVISFVSPAAASGLWLSEVDACFDCRAAWWETDSKRRRELAEKAIRTSDRMLQHAEASGYPDVIQGMHENYCSNLISLAKMERDSNRKRDLLEQALQHNDIANKIWYDMYPREDNMSGGVATVHRAEIELDIAALASDPQERLKQVKHAISNMKQGTDALQRVISELAAKGHSEAVETWSTATGHFLLECARSQASLGGIDAQYSLEAGKQYIRAAETYRRSNFPNLVAECYWLAAQQYSILGDHARASEIYLKASREYVEASEKLKQLKAFYAEHAIYMQAWSEIESARAHHARQDAVASREHFAKAAELHKQTIRWAFLAPNYSAWVEVERGEELSREERSDEAIEVFRRAARLFEEASSSIRSGMDRLDVDEERQNASGLITVAELRREYCLGRIEIEEARLLDKKGDELGSSEKYGRAAETYEKLVERLESDQDRREIRSIATLSRAWQAMARAEGESSPEFFDQASQLFEQAKDLSQGENAKLLALGHSRFCKALGAGMKFADTGEVQLHEIAAQNLEAAAKYYLRAGLKGESEYAKASKLMLDGHLYMNEATREKDPARKAKLFAMTEKVLSASAASFAKARHEKKRDQVVALLDKVKEDRQLAASLADLFQAPDVISTTRALESPTPTQERAVGIERFEHSDVQATIVVRRKELNVDEELEYELELVNAGRVSAQLVKIESIAPPGFEVVGKPDSCKLEENHLNLKGRRLDSLKTEDIKLSVRPTSVGRFELRPRVLYIDESGYYKLREIEPVEIVVKELGISGWLRGGEKRKQTV